MNDLGPSESQATSLRLSSFTQEKLLRPCFKSVRGEKSQVPSVEDHNRIIIQENSDTKVAKIV